MNVPLPPDVQTQLDQLAATGADVNAYVAEALRDRLALRSDQPPPPAEGEWQAELKQWAESFPDRPTNMDDGRESIYGERGQ